MKSIFAFVTLLLCITVIQAQQTCIDESGKSVDWWMIIKAPKSSGSSDARYKIGHAYIYLDSNTIKKSSSFSISKNKLGDSTSALGRTIQSMYDTAKNDATGWVLYNDDTPEDKTSSYYAHAKGVLNWNKSKGFWLVHSMPGFVEGPSKQDTFSVPDSGVIYGQSFLCLSLDISNIDTVALQLQYMNPQIYDQSLPDSSKSMKNMNDLFNGIRQTKTGASSTRPLTTMGGESFTSFAKNTRWNKDLYAELVSLAFKSDLQVETWMRPFEKSYYPPDTQYQIVNVKTLKFPAGDLAVQWGETQDHSKWATSIAASKSVVCIGDINKQPSQWKRGGGTVCLIKPNVHKAFSALVVETDGIKGAMNSDGSADIYPSEDLVYNMSHSINGSKFTENAGIEIDNGTYLNGTTDLLDGHAIMTQWSSMGVLIAMFMVLMVLFV